MVTAGPQHAHHRRVHDQDRDRTKQCRITGNRDRLLCILFTGAIGTLLMVLFARKSTDHADTGKALVDILSDSVELFLYDTVPHKCHADDHKKRHQKQERTHTNHDRHRRIQNECRHDTTDRDKWNTEHQSDEHGHTGRNLIHIGSHRDIKKGNTELFLLCHAQRSDVCQKSSTQSRADTCTGLRRAVLADRRSDKSHRRHAEHQQRRAHDKSPTLRREPGIHDLTHKDRKEKFQYRFEKFRSGTDDELLPEVLHFMKNVLVFPHTLYLSVLFQSCLYCLASSGSDLFLNRLILAVLDVIGTTLLRSRHHTLPRILVDRRLAEILPALLIENVIGTSFTIAHILPPFTHRIALLLNDGHHSHVCVSFYIHWASHPYVF